MNVHCVAVDEQMSYFFLSFKQKRMIESQGKNTKLINVHWISSLSFECSCFLVLVSLRKLNKKINENQTKLNET